MALDTKYRPRTYGDVLGQEATVAILRQYVQEGRGFHQSYVFCGQHGSGKTTTARILVRALLCTSPQEGDPCDTCHSCKTLLAGDPHECFEELDAASKSGKGDLSRIVEDISYSTFSGRRRIYLIDESHRLSKQALDILLKPMEDCVPGSEEKQLVLLFCTTDPGKMSSTIFSRCAPAFEIKSVPPEVIGQRLAWVSEREGIRFDPEVMTVLAEVSDSHIRDALKLLEGISMLGPVTKESVSKYLRFDANNMALTLLEAMGTDLPRCIEIAEVVAREVSPTAAYSRVAEAALAAYKIHLGVGKPPSQWDAGRLEALAGRGPHLLAIASKFAAPPHRPSSHSLALDSGEMHYALLGHSLLPDRVFGEAMAAPAMLGAAPQHPPPQKEAPGVAPNEVITVLCVAEAKTTAGVWVDPRGIAHTDDLPSSTNSDAGLLAPEVFRDLVNHHLRELSRGGRP